MPRWCCRGKSASLGIYPAVDPLDSTAASSILWWSAGHYVRRVVSGRLCSVTKELQDSSDSRQDELSEEVQAHGVPRTQIQRFLSQPFNVSQGVPGQDGKIVPLKDTIRGFKAIIAGEYDHLPEQASI